MDPYPREMRRLTILNKVLTVWPIIALTVLLIVGGMYFYFIGDSVWNETLQKVRYEESSGEVLYSNLQYAQRRLITGMVMLNIGGIMLMIMRIPVFRIAMHKR